MTAFDTEVQCNICGINVDTAVLRQKMSALTVDDLHVGMRVLLVDGPWHTCFEGRYVDIAHSYGHITEIRPDTPSEMRYGALFQPCVTVDWKGRDGGPLPEDMSEMWQIRRYSPHELYVVD